MELAARNAYVQGVIVRNRPMNTPTIFLAAALASLPVTTVAQGISLSGNAEMGLFGTDAPGETRLQFITDLDLTITATAETDGGLVFGMSIDLDETGGLGEDDDPLRPGW